LEEIPGAIFRRVEDELLQVITGKDDPLIRRQALESMGYSGRKEIVPLIKEAYNNTAEPDWVASALFAMGRSVDPAWGPYIIRMMQSPKANIQLEAVRAAGALELERSRRILLDLLEEEAQDSELRAAVIWSLSQVGGDEVREVLEKLLEESEDDDETEILENALDNLSFTEDEGLFGLFDFQQLGEPNEEIEDIETYVTRLEGEEDLPALDGADGSSADHSANEPSSGDEEPPSDHNPKTGSGKKPFQRH
jgi:HEAT repeat protein